MVLTVNEQITLELLDTTHTQPIFELVSENRNYLREWLPWVDNMQSAEFIHNFIKGSIQRNKDESEFAFVVKYNKNIVGRIGIYKIDKQNKIGEIGYWIDQKLQGLGIVVKSCKTLINFCFDILHLNRIELRCGTGNKKSQSVPEKLNFHFEGVLRQAELVRGKFIDLNIYSLIKSDAL